jgi:hypothetical protein
VIATASPPYATTGPKNHDITVGNARWLIHQRMRGELDLVDVVADFMSSCCYDTHTYSKIIRAGITKKYRKVQIDEKCLMPRTHLTLVTDECQSLFTSSFLDTPREQLYNYFQAVIRYEIRAR